MESLKTKSTERKFVQYEDSHTAFDTEVYLAQTDYVLQSSCLKSTGCNFLGNLRVEML